MSERRWAHHNSPCESCRGWGGHIVNRGTDWEDSLRCFDCRGTGFKEKTMNTNTMSHTNDPETSNIAATAVNPHDSKRLKLALIDLLVEEPRTADELSEAYFNVADANGWPILVDRHNVKRRLSELHAKHHVTRESGDRRPSALGRPATVWELSVDPDMAREVVSAS